MNNTPGQRPQYDDEISLVDLVATLIRRRRVFYAVFGGLVLLALLYVIFLAGEVKGYSTLVQLAEDDNKPLESPAAVIASVDNRWYPELRTLYAETEGEMLPFKVSTGNPKDTILIKLSSEASREIADVVREMHQQLVDQIVQHQSDLLERQKRTLEQQLGSINNILEQLSSHSASGEAVAQVIQERVYLEARLESLQPTKVLVVARESSEGAGASKTLVLALAIVLGLMLGIFAAFIAEFAGHVSRAMREDKSRSV